MVRYVLAGGRDAVNWRSGRLHGRLCQLLLAWPCCLVGRNASTEYSTSTMVLSRFAPQSQLLSILREMPAVFWTRVTR